MNGQEGAGPLLMSTRRELLARLLQLQEETGLTLINEEELLLIQRHWKGARSPDDGQGVARIVGRHKGIIMKDLEEMDRLRQLEEQVCEEKNLSHETLRRLVATIEEYEESHRRVGLPADLMRILNDELLSNRHASIELH